MKNVSQQHVVSNTNRPDEALAISESVTDVRTLLLKQNQCFLHSCLCMQSGTKLVIKHHLLDSRR